MKRFLFLVLAIGLFSCVKEKTPTLIGKWTLVKVIAGGTGGNPISSIEPNSVLTIRFYPDGKLETYGPQADHLQLGFCDQYQIIDDQKVKFISSKQNFEMIAFYSFEKELVLSYEGARCGYDEYFIPTLK